MTGPPPGLPGTFVAARQRLQAVATHVLARRRHAVTGRFGLRVSPGGMATPAFGDGEVVRTSGRWLFHERNGELLSPPVDLTTGTLARLAAVVGVDLSAPFSVGRDTPPVPDVELPVGVDDGAAVALADWMGLGAVALDRAIAALDPSAAPVVAQLWPEHFDLGSHVAVDGDRRANLGVSPGDEAEPEPYLYLGPWGPERPGDPAYWNAPFGAVLRRSELLAHPAPALAAEAFWLTGFTALRFG